MFYTMNHSNSTTRQLLNLSLEALRLRVWANGLVISFGLSAMIFNGLLVIVVWKAKSLHTKCFFLIASNGLVDLLLGVAYVFTASKRIYRYVAGIGEVMTRWECFREVSGNAFFQLMALAVPAVLVVDRSIAVIRPMAYKKLTYRNLTIPLILSALAYSTVQIVVHFYDSYTGPSEPTLFSCGVDDSVSDQTLIALMSIQITTSFATVCLNIALGIMIRKKSGNTDNSAGSSRQQKIFKTITITVLLHVFVHVIGRLTIVAEPWLMDEMTQALTNRYVRAMAVASAAVNFFILMGSSSEFLAAAKKVFGFKNTAVEPLGEA